MYEVTLNPITQREVFHVDMTGTGRGFLGIGHGRTPIIVFVRYCSGFLRDIEVLEDAADKQRHATNITCSHILGFSG